MYPLTMMTMMFSIFTPPVLIIVVFMFVTLMPLAFPPFASPFFPFSPVMCTVEIRSSGHYIDRCRLYINLTGLYVHWSWLLICRCLVSAGNANIYVYINTARHGRHSSKHEHCAS